MNEKRYRLCNSQWTAVADIKKYVDGIKTIKQKLNWAVTCDIETICTAKLHTYIQNSKKLPNTSKKISNEQIFGTKIYLTVPSHF